MKLEKNTVWILLILILKNNILTTLQIKLQMLEVTMPKSSERAFFNFSKSEFWITRFLSLWLLRWLFPRLYLDGRKNMYNQRDKDLEIARKRLFVVSLKVFAISFLA